MAFHYLRNTQSWPPRFSTGDAIHYLRRFWELPVKVRSCNLSGIRHQRLRIGDYNGRSDMDLSDNVYSHMTDVRGRQGHNQDYFRDAKFGGRLGISVSIMSTSKRAPTRLLLFGQALSLRLSLTTYASRWRSLHMFESEEFTKRLRRIDQKVMVHRNATLVKS